MLRVRFLTVLVGGWLCLTACTSPLPKVTQPTISPQPLPTFTSSVADPAWQVWRVSSFPSAIYALALQDGRLWASTEFGVWQLDPKTNHIVTHDDRPSAARLLLPIENGQAWASARQGVFFFDGQAWHRIQLTNESPRWGYTAGTAIAVDAAGNLWLEFSDYRGSKYSARYHGHVPAADVMEFDSDGYYGLTMGAIDCDQWPAAARTYGQFYSSAAECRALQSAHQTVLPPSRYPSTQLALDTDGSIWRADLYDGSISHWVNGISTTVGLPAGIRVAAMAPDPTRGVWIGTDRGLAYAAGTELRWLPDLDQYFAPGRPIDLSVESSGEVWVLTAESTLNWRPADRSSAQFEAIANVGARAMAASDGLWITHGTDLIHLKLGEPPSASAHPPVLGDCNLDRLTLDRAGDVWTTTRCGVAWQYQPAASHWTRHALTKPAPFDAEFDPIQRIVASADGTVYAVGLSGLGELTAAGDVITATAALTATALPYPTYRHRALFPSEDSPANRPGILNDSQSAADRQGGIWIAITGQPDLWHYANGQVSTLGHPLDGKSISGLHVDGHGWLWEVGSDQQLAVYDGRAWRTITTPDLGSMRRITSDPDGRLWLVGDHGIAVYDPAKDK